MRYLGIDYGTKKTGLALSDEDGTMGFPKEIIKTDGRLLAYLLDLVKKENVGAIVIGESKSLTSVENTIVRHVKKLSEDIVKNSGLPVFFEPEVFTTQEARRFPTGERAITREPVDAAAAALILTSYLSHHDNN